MGWAPTAVTGNIYFFYGTLCHAPLLEAVLGRAVGVEPAILDAHGVRWAEGHVFPLIVEVAGQQAAGIVVRGLGPVDVARLDFYEGGFAYRTRDLDVIAGGATVVARGYFPDPGHWTPGEVWDLGDWQARLGDTVVATARDFMAHFGSKPSTEVRARYGSMLVRGASRVRALSAAPTALRYRAHPEDVVVDAQREPYARFFSVEETDLSYRRFDGTMSPKVTRAAFVSGDAVTVLPYDPERQRVLVIEQFRAGPHARGDGQPWQIEAIAGRIDPGETPEVAARREAEEEAGLTLGNLMPVASYYPSPGAMAEFLYSFVAVCDLPDGSAGIFGVAGEAEDIRGHLISLDDLLALVVSGEVANAPLILTAFWLQREKDRLRDAMHRAGSEPS